jgi:dihydroneopterin aldolase
LAQKSHAVGSPLRAGGGLAVAVILSWAAFSPFQKRQLPHVSIAMPRDEIRIQELELLAQVGVPDAERARPQRLTATLILQPLNQFCGLEDDLRRTIDYAAVCAELQHFVARRQDRLIETLASEMAEYLLQRFPLFRVELELRKFVLPETRHVAVRVVRQRASGG